MSDPIARLELALCRDITTSQCDYTSLKHCNASFESALSDIHGIIPANILELAITKLTFELNCPEFAKRYPCELKK